MARQSERRKKKFVKKSQKKVHINLRKNKVNNIYCPDLIPIEKEKLQKNKQRGEKLIFEKLPDLTFDTLF